jgi:hypothetical protein
LSLTAAQAYAGFTTAMTRTDLQMEGLKSVAESEQALAAMLMEQSAQISAMGYNSRGQVVPPNSVPSIDARV